MLHEITLADAGFASDKCPELSVLVACMLEAFDELAERIDDAENPHEALCELLADSFIADSLSEMPDSGSLSLLPDVPTCSVEHDSYALPWDRGDEPEAVVFRFPESGKRIFCRFWIES